MASSIIHIAVANEINKTIHRDKFQLLIGSISPDISKLLGESKALSHFLDDKENNIPNINKFLDKYKQYLDNDFVMGYYIHLYTDYLWFKYFVPEIYNEEKNFIKKMDNTIVDCHGKMALIYIYNDYTNLNIDLIDKYNLDLKIFYNEIPPIHNIISEIPMDKLYVIVNKTGEIIENSKITKSMTFDMNSISQFISLCVELIISNLKEIC